MCEPCSNDTATVNKFIYNTNNCFFKRFFLFIIFSKQIVLFSLQKTNCWHQSVGHQSEQISS